MGSPIGFRCWNGRTIVFPLTIMLLSIIGCGSDKASEFTPHIDLNASPRIGDFALEAQNSIRVQTGGVVIAGGDVGAHGTGSSPFLSGGVAIDLGTGVQAPSNRNVIADSVRLGTGVTVGDIQTNRFVDGTGTHHGVVTPLVPLPHPPAASPVNPGTANLTVAIGGILSATAGSYSTVTVGTGGKLRLAAGRYDMVSLTIGAGARLEAQGTVVLRIQGRLSASTNSFIGAASGTTLSARDIRIEVSGINGTSGALGATPPAASVGTGATLTALVLVPNGTLVAGTGISATGAFMARDLDIGGAGSHITFQDGFDCVGAADGTLCDDGNRCTQTDTCVSGVCVGSNPVSCPVSEPCHAGACDRTTGQCSTQVLADGTPCDDGNACTQGDACMGGSCAGGSPVVCPIDPACGAAGTCDRVTGKCGAPGGASVCGDGVVQGCETCDDGNTNDGDGCSSTCHFETCSNGLSSRTAQALRFSWLGRSCGGNADIVFSLNGTEVARAALATSCDCSPGVGTLEVTDPSLLARAKDGTNDFAVSTTGDLAWAVVEVRTPAGNRVQKAWDASGDYGNPWHRPTNLCSAGVQSGVQADTFFGLQSTGGGHCATCGNGVAEFGEECDDGNKVNGDGCSSSCKYEICNGGVSSRSLQGLKFSWLGRSCGNDPGADIVFTVNGFEVARVPLTNTCDCSALPQTVVVTDPSLLALAQYGDISFGAYTTGDLSWANVEGQFASTNWGQRIWDVNGDYNAWHQATNLCSTGSQTGVGSETFMGFGNLFGGKCGTCGNGVIEFPERCDDGNQVNGDGCSSSCMFETCSNGTSSQAVQRLKFSWLGRSCGSGPTADIAFRLNGTEVARVPMAASCSCTPGVQSVEVTDPSLLAWARTSDNVYIDNYFRVETSGELAWANVTAQAQTDDFTQRIWAASGDYDPWHQPVDGCAAGEQLGVSEENDMGLFRQGGRCGICGDGVTDFGEQCDDGNQVNGDGCSSDCKYETCASGKSSRALQALSLSWLGRSCGIDPPADIYFTLDGVEIARAPLPATCDCSPGVQTIAVTDPALLALGKTGTENLAVRTSGELSWAVSSVTTPFSSGENKVWDIQGDLDPTHRPTDMCASGAQNGVAGEIQIVPQGGLCSSCGNGIVEASEQCDDGANNGPNDPCSASCTINNCSGVTCQALDQCHVAGTCDPSTGQCSNPPVGDGAPCDDGSACTSYDACVAGTCQGQSATACPANTPCATWRCDAASGQCVQNVFPDGAACDDGNPCTQGDSCQGGTCTEGSPVTCQASDQCHAPGTCDPAAGGCSNPTLPDGTVCSDGNPCTVSDSCQNGTCTSGSPLACPPAGQCHNGHGTCDPTTGGCIYASQPNGANCDDGNACTQTDICQGGICIGGNPVVCGSSTAPCRTSDGVCDPGSGACDYPGKSDGVSCDDGNASTFQDSCEAGVCIGNPALPSSVTNGIADSLAFIFQAPTGSQVGMPEGTIAEPRAAAIHGRVLTREGLGLAGVTVTVADRPEFGRTLSRGDGNYDLVVNGGGGLTVRLTKDGYFHVERSVGVPWKTHVNVDDVVMVGADNAVTTVAMNRQGMQVAIASPVSDSNGQRQAVVMVPSGTRAMLTLKDGSVVEEGSLSIRMTELTVGQTGPAAMPADLPKTSAYTYALVYTADEAIAAGARRVTFNQPLIHYNENFLGFPVGTGVPVGYYDEDSHQWRGYRDGRVVKVLSVENGLAQLDVDGNGSPAGAETLQALGVSSDELASLAVRYAPGSSLWRVLVPHFSSWDYNWPYGPAPDAISPGPGGAGGAGGAGGMGGGGGAGGAGGTGGSGGSGGGSSQRGDDNSNAPNSNDNTDEQDSPTECGSILEIDNQIVGERLELPGTTFSLNYRSNRVVGHKADRTVNVVLSGPQVPDSLKKMMLRVKVAGQATTQEFSPAPNFGYQYVWNGLDKFGQVVNGEQPIDVSIGFRYGLVYSPIKPPFGVSFAQFGTGATVDAGGGSNWYEIWESLPTYRTVGNFHAKALGLGGWSLDVNHVYDHEGVLWSGDGTRERPPVPNTTKFLNQWDGDHWGGNYYIASAPDGTLYVAQSNGSGGAADRAVKIFRMDSGGSQTPFPFDLSTFERLGPIAVAPDGSLYFTAYYRVSDGTVDFLVGGILHARSDGTLIERYGLPAEYWMGRVLDIAVESDGTAYFTASYQMSGNGQRILGRISPELSNNDYRYGGYTMFVAGEMPRAVGESGDGGPAQVAWFHDGTNGYLPLESVYDPMSLAVGIDGSVYVANGPECSVRRIRTDGIIERVAGTGYCGWIGSPPSVGIATEQVLYNPLSLAVGADGTLYIADAEYTSDGYEYAVVRAVRDGVMTKVAGGSPKPFENQLADGTDALSYCFGSITKLDVSPGGNLRFLMNGNFACDMNWNYGGVGELTRALPLLSSGNSILASQRADELYELDSRGRHLRTIDPLTSATRMTFGYDSNGLLSSITDGNGLITSVQRDQAGKATAIIAANGQMTTLTIDPQGYLGAVDTVGGLHHEFTYLSGDQEGLLASYKNPRGYTSTFTYDDLGRVVSEDMPGACSWQLVRTGPTATNPTKSVKVTLSSKMGTTRNFEHGTDVSGTLQRTMTSAAGLKSSVVKDAAGSVSQTSADGMTTAVTHGPDPRFGMQSPIATKVVTTTPAGTQMQIDRSRTATIDPAENVLQSQTDTQTINGRVSTSTYDASKHTITGVSGEGRQTTTTLDAQGRVAQVQVGNLAPTAYAHDTRGRLSSVTVGTGSTARATSFGYDDLDRLSTVTDPLNRVQSYSYDDANRVVGQTFADNSQVAFSYDANGNVTSVTPPGRPPHAFGFTPNDLMSSYTPPAVSASGATTYEYNLDKQPTVIHRPDGSTINFTYDSAGRPNTVTYPKGPDASDGTMTVTRAYNPTTGNLASVSTSDGQAVAYSYDGSLPLSSTWSGSVNGSVSRAYTNDFLFASESVNGSNTIPFTYDNDGLLTGAGALVVARDPSTGLVSGTTLGNVTDTRVQTIFGEPQDVEAKYSGSTILKSNFARDRVGRIEQKTETVQGVTTVKSYSYDLAGRLWQVMKDGVLTATYLYDSNGNRLSSTTPSGTDAATYDNQDRLLTYGKWAYTYTANGELRTKTDTTTGDVTTYSYDGRGNLRKVKLPDGRLIEYVIDGWRRRIAKKVDGVMLKQWLYRNALDLAAEFDGSGALSARFVYGSDGSGSYLIKGGRSYRVLKDHLGSPRLIVDSQSGAVAQRLDYGEYGTVEGDSAPGFQPMGFAGGLYDPDTGLVHYGARDYDPQAGRWMSKDPLRLGGQDANLYVYVFDDPINLVDRAGLGACTALSEEDKAAIAARDEYYDPFQPREDAGRICKMPNGSCEPIRNPNNTNSPSDSSDPGSPALCGGLQSPATWHDHAAADTTHDNENFSPRDISTAEEIGKPDYVFTPGGKTLKYTPKTDQNGVVQNSMRGKGRYQSLNADETAFCNYKPPLN